MNYIQMKRKRPLLENRNDSNSSRVLHHFDYLFVCLGTEEFETLRYNFFSYYCCFPLYLNMYTEIRRRSLPRTKISSPKIPNFTRLAFGTQTSHPLRFTISRDDSRGHLHISFCLWPRYETVHSLKAFFNSLKKA